MKRKDCPVVKTENVSESEAKKMMDKRDRARRNYFRFWTQKDWADRGNYDLELNTSICPRKNVRRFFCMLWENKKLKSEDAVLC